MIRRVVAGLAAAAALTLGLVVPAHAEIAGQYGVPRTGKICIEDNGWTTYNGALPELAYRMRMAGVAYVVVEDECNDKYALDHVIDIVTANAPSEGYCARTERTWKWNGAKWVVASTNIRMNLGIPSCYDTLFDKRHLLSHEMMHAFGAVHEGSPYRVVAANTGWNYAWPTNTDYRDLRSFGYTDIK